jgi:hypothetical protein
MADDALLIRPTGYGPAPEPLAGLILRRPIYYSAVMVKSLEQAVAELERLPAEDQEQIGRSLLSHGEKLHALRAEIDKGIASLDAGLGKESSIADFLRHKNR